MSWVKLDDGFFDHPKMRAAGKDGRALLTAALCYSASQMTDGLIRDDELGLVAAKAEVRGKPTAARLVEVDAFHRAGHGCAACPQCPDGAFLIHDYHVYQPSAEQERQRRREVSEAKSRAGKMGAEARWGNGKPDGTPIAENMAPVWHSDGPVPVPVPPWGSIYYYFSRYSEGSAAAHRRSGTTGRTGPPPGPHRRGTRLRRSRRQRDR